MNTKYIQQVKLLIKCLNIISKRSCFALKGGTAINLFIRDLPRLSVDIDLVYLPLESRENAMTNIANELKLLANNFEKTLGVKSHFASNFNEYRIIVIDNYTQIKVELSPVMRGALLKPITLSVVDSVEDQFGFAQIQVVSLPDLYGGKICAALDRQHPRDLYDIFMLLASGGINRDIFNGFITYLLSHNRPINEILNPRFKPIEQTYQREFLGMSFQEVTLEQLLECQHRLIPELKHHFTERDYNFLLSFKKGQPNWDLFDHPNIKNLPAIKWKLQNINKIEHSKQKKLLHKLQTTLDEWII